MTMTGHHQTKEWAQALREIAETVHGAIVTTGVWLSTPQDGPMAIIEGRVIGSSRPACEDGQLVDELPPAPAGVELDSAVERLIISACCRMLDGPLANGSPLPR